MSLKLLILLPVYNIMSLPPISSLLDCVQSHHESYIQQYPHLGFVLGLNLLIHKFSGFPCFHLLYYLTSDDVVFLPQKRHRCMQQFHLATEKIVLLMELLKVFHLALIE